MKMNLPTNVSPSSDDEGSTLSANAQPFHPYYEECNIAIYNDGMPSMTLVSEKDRSDILHGIDDDAIDNQFPPDAEDAFEMEMAEQFVCEMANLALLEEREERARKGFTHLKKRWEVRRAMGPSGRPRPAMNLIVPVEHGQKVREHQLVTANQAHRMLVQQDKMRTQEVKMNQRGGGETSRHVKTNQKNRPNIQQPRKHY